MENSNISSAVSKEEIIISPFIEVAAKSAGDEVPKNPFSKKRMFRTAAFFHLLFMAGVAVFLLTFCIFIRDCTVSQFIPTFFTVLGLTAASSAFAFAAKSLAKFFGAAASVGLGFLFMSLLAMLPRRYYLISTLDIALIVTFSVLTAFYAIYGIGLVNTEKKIRTYLLLFAVSFVVSMALIFICAILWRLDSAFLLYKSYTTLATVLTLLSIAIGIVFLKTDFDEASKFEKMNISRKSEDFVAFGLEFSMAFIYVKPIVFIVNLIRKSKKNEKD